MNSLFSANDEHAEIELMYAFGPTPEASLPNRGWLVLADILAQEDSASVKVSITSMISCLYSELGLEPL